MKTPRLLLLFNHTLTPAQKEDALRSLHVSRWVSPPRELAELWGQIPPELQAIRDYLAPVFDWLEQEARAGDYILVQGDFGACCLVVQKAFELGLIPVYSTTVRETVEEIQPDGSIRLEHHFRHKIFRRYGV